MGSQTISHYRIVKKLGAGGMGEVYLAEDTRLDRKVALKVLPSEFVSNEDRLRRFVQEAKAAAALSHPNIAHIYEVGEADGTHFIAMEFVDGDTLTAKIARDKNPLSTLLKFLSQVAEGLAKAHAAGIVHRDLKPDNIMITRDGYAKILDFGLAKLIETRSSSGAAGASEEAATAMMPVQPLSAPGLGDGNRRVYVARAGTRQIGRPALGHLLIWLRALRSGDRKKTVRTGYSLAYLGHAYAMSGRRDEALAVLKELEGKYNERESLGQYLAAVYTGLGDKDEAFAWLEKDFEARSGFLDFVIVDVGFDPLRSDPRYADLLRRMGLKP